MAIDGERRSLALAPRSRSGAPGGSGPAVSAVVNLRASYTIPTRGAIHQFSANVFNVGDQLYRNHASFIKDLAPEMGRGVRFSYMLRFF